MKKGKFPRFRARGEPLRRPGVILWVAALVAVALACACKAKTGGGDDEGGGDNVVPVATVTVTKVVRGDIRSWLTITGTVAAESSVLVSPTTFRHTPRRMFNSLPS